MLSFRSDKPIETQITISQLTHQYQSILSQNYQKQRQKLVQQLTQQITKYQKQLHFYKKQTSQDNIDKLINQKRRQKQKQRQKLQNRWRQLNQIYKQLQEQLKILNSQLEQSRFDKKNIKNKIKMFKNKKQKENRNIQRQKNDQEKLKFLTECSQNLVEINNDPLGYQQITNNITKQQKESSNTIVFQQSSLINNSFNQIKTTSQDRYPYFKFEKNKNNGINDNKYLKTLYNYHQQQCKMKREKPKVQNQVNKHVYNSKRMNVKELQTFLMSDKIKSKVYDILYRKL